MQRWKWAFFLYSLKLFPHISVLQDFLAIADFISAIKIEREKGTHAQLCFYNDRGGYGEGGGETGGKVPRSQKL